MIHMLVSYETFSDAYYGLLDYHKRVRNIVPLSTDQLSIHDRSVSSQGHEHAHVFETKSSLLPLDRCLENRGSPALSTGGEVNGAQSAGAGARLSQPARVNLRSWRCPANHN